MAEASGQFRKGKRPVAGLSGRELRLAIVVSRFNGQITEKLLKGARTRLESLGVASEDIEVLRAPGAFELPQAAQRLAQSGNYQGIIALGCIIRGQTPHFNYLAQAVSYGLMRVSLCSQVPLTFGVLTVERPEQAEARAGATPEANKGAEAAESLVELIRALDQLRATASSQLAVFLLYSPRDRLCDADLGRLRRSRSEAMASLDNDLTVPYRESSQPHRAGRSSSDSQIRSRKVGRYLDAYRNRQMVQ